MAATTDYDAPRRSTLEDEADAESLDRLTAARTEKQSPVVDLDEGDSGESVELPVVDLSGEELTMPVIPKRRRVHLYIVLLVLHRSRLAARSGGPMICMDCA